MQSHFSLNWLTLNFIGKRHSKRYSSNVQTTSSSDETLTVHKNAAEGQEILHICSPNFSHMFPKGFLMIF